MSGPTANLPVGLLDALGIKSGSYPNELSSTILTYIDTLPIVAAQACTDFLELTVAVSTTGFNSFSSGYQVPQGEAWLVRNFSASCTTGAAEQIEFKAIAYKSGITYNSVLRSPEVNSGKVAVGASAVLSCLPGPFWLTSIDLLAVHVASITTAGSISITSRANFVRCRR